MYLHCGSPSLWSIESLPLLSLTALPVQQLSAHILTSSTFTDHMFYNITDALSFSFLFPLSPTSIEQFHCYKDVLHLSLYMIMFVFVYMFIFWICLPHIEKKHSLCLSVPGSLNMMSSNCIHLPSNHMSLFLWLTNTPLCIYTTISWSIHQL
jgi:hypothetical protein